MPSAIERGERRIGTDDGRVTARAARCASPAVRAVFDAVVQPDARPCQNSNASRHEPIAAPVRRPRHVVAGKAPLAPRRTALRAPRDRAAARFAATPTRRGATAAAATRKYASAVAGVDRLDVAFDADLALELGPEEEQRRVRPRRELPSLAAVVVRVEREAARVDAPSAARCAPRAGPRRRRSRASSRSARAPAPRRAASNHCANCAKRIAVDVALVERRALVVGAQVGELDGRVGHAAGQRAAHAPRLRVILRLRPGGASAARHCANFFS